MRFIFTCGGTAGHIYPAVAVANLIKEKMPESEILFVGAEGKMETELVPKEGYEIRTVKITNFSRAKSLSGLKHNLITAKNVLSSAGQAKKILNEFKPDAVIGTGGYASYPVLKAAAKRNIPTAVHESNATPGLTTRVLSKIVDRVMVAFEESRQKYDDPQKVVVTGTPVRNDFSALSKENAKSSLGLSGKKVVLSFWGSLGASFMNEKMEEFFAMETGEFYHIHATGKGKMKKLVAGIENNGGTVNKEYEDIKEYIYNMPQLMAASDVVLCRAGASTLAELMASGTASILVPSPNVTDNHQEKNARLLESADAAVVMTEGSFTTDELYQKVTSLLSDEERLKTMEDNARKLSVADATERIYSIIMEVINDRKK